MLRLAWFLYCHTYAAAAPETTTCDPLMAIFIGEIPLGMRRFSRGEPIAFTRTSVCLRSVIVVERPTGTRHKSTYANGNQL